MPSIRSIQKLSDGVTITTSRGDILTLKAADIPAAVRSQSPANIQAWINSWVTTKRGGFATCRVKSVTPLDVDIVVSDSALSPDWVYFRSG